MYWIIQVRITFYFKQSLWNLFNWFWDLNFKTTVYKSLKCININKIFDFYNNTYGFIFIKRERFLMDWLEISLSKLNDKYIHYFETLLYF